MLPIEEGNVVPVVGRDLLVIETDNGPRLLHNLLAEELARELGIPTNGLPDHYDCNDVICAQEKFTGDASSLSRTVVRILKGLKVPIPESLRLLAEIQGFRVFVSATFDTLLEQAITSVRGVSPATAAFPAASGNTDFDPAQLESKGSFVFQILGRASASSDFGLTEGLVLEQMHDLMVGTGRPIKLIRHLQENHLLVLGVSFPDWLSRFLLRLARSKPLWDARNTSEVIAERGADQSLSLFLKRFSPDHSHLFAGDDPVAFVRELHARWTERHPPNGDEFPPPGEIESSPTPINPGSIFISYAKEDRSKAMALKAKLEAHQLEVWIDERLQMGAQNSPHWPIIERNIRESCAFVAVLSQNTLGDTPRAFRREWAMAYEREKDYFGGDNHFIYPVAVDATSPSQLTAGMQKIFGVGLYSAIDGQPPPHLLPRLDDAQKKWRLLNRR